MRQDVGRLSPLFEIFWLTDAISVCFQLPFGAILAHQDADYRMGPSQAVSSSATLMLHDHLFRLPSSSDLALEHLQTASLLRPSCIFSDHTSPG